MILPLEALLVVAIVFAVLVKECKRQLNLLQLLPHHVLALPSLKPLPVRIAALKNALRLLDHHLWILEQPAWPGLVQHVVDHVNVVPLGQASEPLEELAVESSILLRLPPLRFLAQQEVRMVDVDQHAGGIHADHLAPQREGGVRGHDNLDLVTEVKKGTVLLLACGQRDVFLHVDVREALLDGIVKDLQIHAHD